MESGAKEERDRDTYLRWQRIAIEQLGYVINLFLTLCTAVLGFAVKAIMQPALPLPACSRHLFEMAMLPLVGSIACSLIANVTRAADFRYTHRAAYARWKSKPEHDALQDKSDRFGKWTWRLFYAQTGLFGLGILTLCLSVWIGYSHNI
jgi:hypothetical protein